MKIKTHKQLLVLDRPPKVIHAPVYCDRSKKNDPTKAHSTRTATATAAVVVRAQRIGRVDGPDSDLFKLLERDAAVAVLVVFGEQRAHFEVWRAEKRKWMCVRCAYWTCMEAQIPRYWRFHPLSIRRWLSEIVRLEFFNTAFELPK